MSTFGERCTAAEPWDFNPPHFPFFVNLAVFWYSKTSQHPFRLFGKSMEPLPQVALVDCRRKQKANRGSGGEPNCCWRDQRGCCSGCTFIRTAWSFFDSSPRVFCVGSDVSTLLVLSGIYLNAATGQRRFAKNLQPLQHTAHLVPFIFAGLGTVGGGCL